MRGAILLGVNFIGILRINPCDYPVTATPQYASKLSVALTVLSTKRFA